jgi:hypothetical protein
MAQALPGLQFSSVDGDPVALRAENIERVFTRLSPLTATEQHRDQAGRKFLRASAVVLGGSGRCAAPPPGELDGNRLDLFRNPGAVNASECQHVVATSGNGADFGFFVREHNCFEDGSVGVSDSHNYILRPRSERKPVLGALFRNPMRHRTPKNVNYFSETNVIGGMVHDFHGSVFLGEIGRRVRSRRHAKKPNNCWQRSRVCNCEQITKRKLANLSSPNLRFKGSV